MRKSILGISLLALAVTAGSTFAVQLSSEAAPVILSTEVESSGRTMTIVGRNFGEQPPTVFLAERPLRVQAHSTTELTVALPADIRQATYLLMVSTPSGSAAVATFNTVVRKTAGL